RQRWKRADRPDPRLQPDAEYGCDALDPVRPGYRDRTDVLAPGRLPPAFRRGGASVGAVALPRRLAAAASRLHALSRTLADPAGRAVRKHPRRPRLTAAPRVPASRRRRFPC